MRLRFRIWAMAVVFGLLLMLAGSLLWLVGTNDGARWMLRCASPYFPVAVTVDRFEGSLAGELKMEGIRFHHDEWDLGIAKAAVSWRPFSLAFGQLAFEAVHLEDVLWDMKNPRRKHRDLSWPKIPHWLTRIWGGVQTISVDRFAYMEPDKAPIRIDRMSAALRWHFGTMTIADLVVQSSVGKLSGTVEAGFGQPSLSGDLVVVPRHEVAGYHRLEIALKPAGNIPEQVSGLLKLTVYKGEETPVTVLGRIDMKKDRFVFADMEVRDQERKGVLKARGEIILSQPEMVFNLELRAEGLHLVKDKSHLGVLSGTLALKGSVNHYEGRLDLHGQSAGKERLSLSLAGNIAGSDRGLTGQAIKGEMLGGSLTGAFSWAWEGGNRLSWTLQGRGLDPARLNPDWTGRVNLNAAGSWRWSKSAPMQGLFKVTLPDSLLRGRTLRGFMEARWEEGVFLLDQCDLQGRGFHLTAHGLLEKRLDYRLTVTDLSGLWPGAAGRIGGDGWIRLQNRRWGGALKGHADALSLADLKISLLDIDARVNDGAEDGIAVKLSMIRPSYGAFRVDRAELSLDGSVLRHHLHGAAEGPEGSVFIDATGGYGQDVWQGTLTRGGITDKQAGALTLSVPAALALSANHLHVNSLSLTGANDESLYMDGDLSFKPRQGRFRVQWQKMNLARVNAVLRSGKMSGQTSGSINLVWSGDKRLQLSGSGSGAFIWMKDDLVVNCTQANARVEGSEKGLSAKWDLSLNGSGRFEGDFSSREPVAATFPEQGQFRASWQSVEAGLINPLFNKALSLQGRINGRIRGTVQKGSHVQAKGEMDLSTGRASWKTDRRVLSAAARHGVLDFTWEEKALQGTLSVDLSDYGQVSGSFQLPIPARFPVKPDENGPLRLHVKGTVQETGLLTAVFPGVVKEARGKMAFDLGVGGTWKEPDFTGSAHLEGAGAEFPAAGIRLEDANADIEWVHDRIRIQAFRVRSGEAYLRGSATIWLKNWDVARYEGQLAGENIQTVYLPEIRLWTNPDIRFSGTAQKLILKGTVQIPKALIQYDEREGVMRASRDVIIVDLPKKGKKTSSLAVDAQLTVTLGDQVQIAAAGLHARLGGKVLLKGQSLDKVLADGQLVVVKGYYERYGVKLDIVRGRLVFISEPVELGSLDILALKKIRDAQSGLDVEAGVTITGNLRSPLVKLYGRPAMSDRDVISYMVIGRPFKEDTGGSQKEQIAQWAAAIFAGTPSSSYPRQLQEKLGIDSVGVETKSTGGVTRSLVTVGKYLSPDLYISFARSLFGDDYYISTRYSFLRHWQIETRVGQQSSTDIFYRIDFD